MNKFSSSLSATCCHLYNNLVNPCSKVLTTVKVVTVLGTGTSLTFQASIIPKLPPPPPLIAQNKSSPMAFLSKIFPSGPTILASTTLSTPNPYFLIIDPYAPPVI
uniref:Uncharacterized protein n=1 Tax=Opuntia streptacantha TaxID=393608 RepID=A0A7C8YHS2_OPUST